MPNTFEFQAPSIPSAGVYYFNSGENVEYEVRFGRKQADILAANLVFGVINEEYEGEEYVLTNKGEFYSVMKTIEAIIDHFLEHNPNIHSIEFAGEPDGSELDNNTQTKRTKVYIRHAKRIFSSENWKIYSTGNKVSVERIDKG